MGETLRVYETFRYMRANTAIDNRYFQRFLCGLVYLVYTEPDVDEVHLVTARFAERWMVEEYEENRERR